MKKTIVVSLQEIDLSVARDLADEIERLLLNHAIDGEIEEAYSVEVRTESEGGDEHVGLGPR